MINNQFDPEVSSLYELAEKIRTADSAKQSTLIKIYLAELQAIIGRGWTYALGKANEIDESALPGNYLAQRDQVIEDLQIKLGRCAERYRASAPNSPSDKKALADYYQTYEELIRITGRIIALDPDSELPDDLMPKEYVNYWLKG